MQIPNQNWFFTSLALCSIALWWAGCSGDPESVSPPAPRPIYAFEVEEPSSTIQRGFSGSLRANEGLDYGFEVGGRIETIRVKAGQFLSEGTIIATLNKDELQNQLKNAEAQFDKANADFKRTRALNVSGNASNASLEQATANRLRLDTERISAEKRLADSDLLMPYDGVIGSVLAEVQQIVSPGTGVVTIQGDGNLEMTIGLPALWINEIDMDYPAMVQVGPIANEKGFPAKIVEISQNTSQNTTYPVILELKSSDERLREGMDGEAFFEFKNPEGSLLLIPFTCVVASGSDTPLVWKVNTQSTPPTVSKHSIKVGLPRDDGKVEVLDGVLPGDILVSKGVHRLEEGMKVQLLSE